MRGLATLLVLGLALLLWAIVVHEPPQIAVENRSGVGLVRVTLVVEGVEVDLGSLAAGNLDRHPLPLSQEGPAHLRLEFENGRILDAKAGWVSRGRSDLPRIVVHSVDSVSVER